MATAAKQSKQPKSTLASKLQELRAAAGKTQQQVAEEAGINESTVRNYELGRRVPAPEHLVGLAKALDVAPEALCSYGFEGDPDAAFHALIALGDDYGLDAMVVGKEALIVPTSDFMQAFVERWAKAYAKYSENEAVQDERYERWKDSYSDAFQEVDYPHIYPEFDPSSEDAAQRWRMAKLSESLTWLREARGMTQDDLSEASDISKFTIRSYEQEKRYPKDAQIDALAEALGVSSGALKSYYFGSPNHAAHALFKLCEELDLYPSKKDKAIRANDDCPYRYAVVEWAQKREELAASDATEKDVRDYKLWEAEFALVAAYENGRGRRKERL